MLTMKKIEQGPNSSNDTNELSDIRECAQNFETSKRYIRIGDFKLYIQGSTNKCMR